MLQILYYRLTLVTEEMEDRMELPEKVFIMMVVLVTVKHFRAVRDRAPAIPLVSRASGFTPQLREQADRADCMLL